MNTKLTLKLDNKVIEKAKKYAVSQQMSLSKIIESYLKSLVISEGSENKEEIQISPFVKSISSGINIPADLDYKSEYTKHLFEKHK